MAYEARTFQSTTTNTPPTGTDPLVDNTASGDVQAIKLLDPTAGSTTPLIGQKARTGSTPVALSTEDAALLADLLTNTTFTGRIPTNGQKTMAGSLPVVVASDQSAVPVDTELPAAGALADGATNPTTPSVGSLLLGYNGATWDRVRVQAFRVDLNAVSITSIATVWTPTSGKKFRLMGGSISVSAVCNVLFEDNSAGAGNFVWRTPKLAADTPYNFDMGNGKLSAAVNNVLKATASAAATVTGTLYGVEE